VKRRKARSAATLKARDRSRSDQGLAAKISADAIPDPFVMQAIHFGEQCLGFIYSRGRFGYEGFDRDTKSIGIFPDQKSAAEAVITEAARGTP
jgi:hypothetical protein